MDQNYWVRLCINTSEENETNTTIYLAKMYQCCQRLKGWHNAHFSVSRNTNFGPTIKHINILNDISDCGFIVHSLCSDSNFQGFRGLSSLFGDNSNNGGITIFTPIQQSNLIVSFIKYT